jgi:uncharacterized protein (DUF2062 family)
MRTTYPYRWLRLHLWMALRTLLRLRGTPHAIALGVSIGVFVALTPTVGLQMIIAVFLATVAGGNRLAAAAGPWITNPVTIVPIYTFNYWVGWLLVPAAPGVEDFRQELGRMLRQYEEGGVFAAAGSLFELGFEVLLPLWLGCLLVGLAAAAPAYPLVRRLVVVFRHGLERKRAARQARVEERLSAREAAGAEDPAPPGDTHSPE